MEINFQRIAFHEPSKSNGDVQNPSWVITCNVTYFLWLGFIHFLVLLNYVLGVIAAGVNCATDMFLLELLFFKIFRFNPLMHNVPKWSDTLWKSCSRKSYIFKDTLKAFDHFKKKQKSIWNKDFWYVKKYVYDLKVYLVHYTLR